MVEGEGPLTILEGSFEGVCCEGRHDIQRLLLLLLGEVEQNHGAVLVRHQVPLRKGRPALQVPPQRGHIRDTLHDVLPRENVMARGVEENEKKKTQNPPVNSD